MSCCNGMDATELMLQRRALLGARMRLFLYGAHLMRQKSFATKTLLQRPDCNKGSVAKLAAVFGEKKRKKMLRVLCNRGSVARCERDLMAVVCLIGRRSGWQIRTTVQP